ncbi:uncharacterized protein LOC130228438 [Danio aesculapii]|uniref:uncharacterized protein LOC130228438 n=1 Tax=Danio aesculapii TaxID=1142201 RepID=UPI0024C08E8A|nr:uncharacterized protein LOC130228438 [Danio aesculapii]
MKLTVKFMSGYETLEVSDDASVGELKQRIFQLVGVITYEQKLCVNHDKNNILKDDSRSLSSYGLNSGSEVILLIKQSFQVFVRNHSGQTKTYDVDANETVDQLREKVYRKERVPVDEQLLTCNSKQLQSGMKLQDYDIKAGSTIDLGLRLRGG